MTGPTPRRLGERVSPPLRKMISSLVAGSVAYLGASVISDEGPPWSLGFGFFIACVAFIAQQLIDLYHGTVAARAAQEATAAAIRELVERRFDDLGEANRLFTAIGRSLVSHADIGEVVAGLVTLGTRPPLVQALVLAQFRRFSRLVKELSEGVRADYEGEDRDVLLTVTGSAAVSIDAISIVTVESGQIVLDGGPRRSDRAQRYFDAQLAAAQHPDGTPKVAVRRILVIEHASVGRLPEFVDLRASLDSAGIRTRVWDLSTGIGREYGDSSEMVLVDGVACYLPSPAARTSRGERPVLINTRLEIEPEQVRRRTQHFERLWTALTGEYVPEPDLGQRVTAPPLTPSHR